MKHPNWKKLYSYAAGESSSDEIEKHVLSCARCKAELKRTKTVIEALKQTDELDPSRAPHIIDAVWDAKRTTAARRFELRPNFVPIPLLLLFVIVVSIWLVVQNMDLSSTVGVSKEQNILKAAELAAKEIGLDNAKIDYGLLEQSEVDFGIEHLEIDLPDENTLPTLTSSYLYEVLGIDSLDALLRELGVDDVEGQTSFRRLS